MVVHACNPSNSGRLSQEDHRFKVNLGNLGRLSLSQKEKKKKKKRKAGQLRFPWRLMRLPHHTPLLTALNTIMLIFYLFYFYVVLRIKPSASHVLGKGSATEPQPQPTIMFKSLLIL
ncbi:Hypothetical predicted protein [Marmota monax]|uniref:Transmembrane protein n=1 Tax=Marmota monax TaxID=9995 RepID=A0A5E4BEL2_MARMO|nr:Hypothetical predicted protein [Marmota monax]